MQPTAYTVPVRARPLLECRKPACFEEKAVLAPRLRCVLFANCSAKADLLHASEHMGGNIGTARVVAEVFRKLFFAAVRSSDARPNRYLRNREPPGQMTQLLWVNESCASNFRFPPDVGPDAVCKGRLRLLSQAGGQKSQGQSSQEVGDRFS
jgi:hypothetical protein